MLITVDNTIILVVAEECLEPRIFQLLILSGQQGAGQVHRELGGNRTGTADSGPCGCSITHGIVLNNKTGGAGQGSEHCLWSYPHCGGVWAMWCWAACQIKPQHRCTALLARLPAVISENPESRTNDVTVKTKYSAMTSPSSEDGWIPLFWKEVETLCIFLNENWQKGYILFDTENLQWEIFYTSSLDRQARCQGLQN